MAPSCIKLKALEKKLGERRRRDLVSIFAITALPLLREASAEQVCEALSASAALQKNTASEVLV